MSGIYYSSPSRQLTPTTAQLALTSTAEWRASNVKLGRNGPNVSRRCCYHQAQQTRMIAHSHSFKTTPCQRSKAVTGATGACPQKQPLPIYRPPMRGMDGLVSQPNWRALPLVASYDRQALGVDEFLPAHRSSLYQFTDHP